ncbi:MAG: carboxymuconolactone decarboxylase family protein [Dehalococcoidia bacterium]|nr:MAG: carboxymuconolactone decarboxylase family protein [Dehalococcoidia bacterium]
MQGYIDQLETMREEVGKIDPEFLAAWSALSAQGGKEGMLSVKTKELICIAIGVASRCNYCIAAHVKKALLQGATRREILEAGFVAVKMGGGPSLGYLSQVIAACDEFGAK